MITARIPLNPTPHKNFFPDEDVIDNKVDPLKVMTIPNSTGAVGDTSSLCREDARRKTFTASWPHSHLDPNLLAQTGFYYVGANDNVKCFFCKVEIGRWEPDDREVTEHQRWSQNCPLLRRRPTNNVPINAEELDRVLPPRTVDVCGSGIDIRQNTVSEGSFDVFPGSSVYQPMSMTSDSTPSRSPEHPEYAIEAARLRSYEDWPKTMKQKPQDLSDAGFFYTLKGDRVKCFSCGGGLRDWDEMDVPWEQHAQWFAHCEYLQLIKGQEYIDQVQAANNKRENLKNAEGETDVKNIHFEVQTSIASALSPTAVDEEMGNVGGNGSGSAGRDSKLCKICYSCEYNTAFLPCGHVVACAKCASSVTKCPMCRKPFERVMRVYFS